APLDVGDARDGLLFGEPSARVDGGELSHLLVRPFLDLVRTGASERQELLLREDHLRPRGRRELEVAGEEDRLLGADLLAVAAHDAAQHVDVEPLRPLLHVRRELARLDRDRLRRADELAELAGDALRAAVLIRYEHRNPAETRREHGALLGVLERHLLLEQVLERQRQAARDFREIDPLPEVELAPLHLDRHGFDFKGVDDDGQTKKRPSGKARRARSRESPRGRRHERGRASATQAPSSARVPELSMTTSASRNVCVSCCAAGSVEFSRLSLRANSSRVVPSPARARRRERSKRTALGALTPTRTNPDSRLRTPTSAGLRMESTIAFMPAGTRVSPGEPPPGAPPRPPAPPP